MIPLIFILLAAIANATMDVLKFRFKRSIFNRPELWFYKYVEPQSWRNKWKNRDVKQGEAFWLSSTVLVFITDLWHLAQFIMKNVFILGMVIWLTNLDINPHWNIYLYSLTLYWQVDFVIMSVTYSLVFELFFSKIFITKFRKQ